MKPLCNVRAVERDDASAEANCPYGFFGFEVHGLSTPGDCTEVTLFLSLNPDQYLLEVLAYT